MPRAIICIGGTLKRTAHTTVHKRQTTDLTFAPLYLSRRPVTNPTSQVAQRVMWVFHHTTKAPD